VSNKIFGLSDSEKKLIRKVAKGLISIAEQAMPDSFLASDSRVKSARLLLSKLKGS
jgi:hypothetical protein